MRVRSVATGRSALVVRIAETVEPQPQTAHVVLRLGKALDGGRVGRVADDPVGKRRRQLRAHAVVTRDLRPRIFVLLGHVGAVQVREDRGRLHAPLRREADAQPRAISSSVNPRRCMPVSSFT